MKHKIALNILGGSFCERCHHWSNLPDGLNDYECPGEDEPEEVLKPLNLTTNPMKENKTDKSVKQYQEDIKAGVDVSGKTEQIRESELQDEFMAFWDEYKDKVGLGNYSDEVTRFWFKKLSEQRQDMLSKIKGLGCNPENDSLTIARILNKLR